MSRILEDLSIYTNVCMTTDRASHVLRERCIDLIVVDSEDCGSIGDLLQSGGDQGTRRKFTVVVISEQEQPPLGANLLLRKPFTLESGGRLMRMAHSEMVRDYRRKARYALMSSVFATDETGGEVPVTILDVSREGVGIYSKQTLAVGEVLTFPLSLPGVSKGIRVEARILWTRAHGVAGCKFLRMSPEDIETLQYWLAAKDQIKKPASCLVD